MGVNQAAETVESEGGGGIEAQLDEVGFGFFGEIGEAEYDQAEKVDFIQETGDGLVGESEKVAAAEQARVEAVLEGVVVAGLGTTTARRGAG